MPFLTPQRGKRLFCITVTLLIAAGTVAGKAPGEASVTASGEASGTASGEASGTASGEASVEAAGRKSTFYVPSASEKPLPAQLYFFSNCPASHILGNYPLYEGDTTLLKSRVKPGVALRKNEDGKTSGIIRREKNGDLVIVIPEAAREKYKIRFFDDDNNFLFEVGQIRDPLLILEKYNFQHTGLFQYELYRENQLVERSTFLIRKD
jgi:hypothetical protein